MDTTTARRPEVDGSARAAVSSLTNTLSAAGLLARAADPRDGRAVVLSLTEAGGRALESVPGAHPARGRVGGPAVRRRTGYLQRGAGQAGRAAQTEAWVNHRG